MYELKEKYAKAGVVLDIIGEPCPKCKDNTKMVDIYDDDPYQVCPKCGIIYFSSKE
jgi:ribosomal protein S27AE